MKHHHTTTTQKASAHDAAWSTRDVLDVTALPVVVTFLVVAACKALARSL